MKFNLKIIIVLVLSFTNLSGLFSQNEIKFFKDSLDGAFDLSRWLLDLHGFIPIISPITEPALGYGAAVAGVYFIPKKNIAKNEFKMPDIVGVAGGYTQNGTWFAGAGYAGFWKDDHIRYRGIFGYGNINLKYYGSGNSWLAENPVKFSMESYFFLQQSLFRIKESPFMLGGNYFFGKTKVTLFEDIDIPEVNPLDFDLINSGISAIGEYETFNNVLSPTKGIRVNLQYTQALELFGSDRNNSRLSFFTIYYLPVNDKWVSGFRVESMLASENTPFYMMPFVKLRGVPALRYQGEMTMLAETEQLFNIYKRWSVVSFCGIGTTIPSLDEMNFGTTVWNAGAGFRYKVARLLGLQMGLDVARGPEDMAFYIVFGNAWLK
ncbi:MAG: hypothetical protein U9N53_04485 [Bacteroidota bacterium]|nr:hypothetical protein [Bacteroidota bacterium]